MESRTKPEAIRTPVSGIVSDFNNILGAISGFAELALEKVPADNKAKQYLRQIYGAAPWIWPRNSTNSAARPKTNSAP